MRPPVVWPSSVMDGARRSFEMPVVSVSFPGCLSDRAVFNSSSAGRALDAASSTSFVPNQIVPHPGMGRPFIKQWFIFQPITRSSFYFRTCLSRVLNLYGFIPLGISLGGGLRTREKGWAAGFGRLGFPQPSSSGSHLLDLTGCLSATPQHGVKHNIIGRGILIDRNPDRTVGVYWGT